MYVYQLLNFFTPLCSGIPGGEENGERGYLLTFVIAYVRVSLCVVLYFGLLVCVKEIKLLLLSMYIQYQANMRQSALEAAQN